MLRNIAQEIYCMIRKHLFAHVGSCLLVLIKQRTEKKIGRYKNVCIPLPLKHASNELPSKVFCPRHICRDKAITLQTQKLQQGGGY